MRNVDLTPVCNYTMSSGLGSLENNKVCVVAQAAILDALSKGQPITTLTDVLDCACPVLRVLAIALNDGGWWDNDQERTKTLRPLISLLLDSKRDSVVTAQRAVKASLFAKHAAEYAAESAESAKCAESAAKSAKSAKYAAECAAECAATIPTVKTLRNDLLKTWMECEAAV